MTDRLPVGPYRTISAGGLEVPFYVVPFDKRGRCTGPQTRQHLIDTVASAEPDAGFTHLFLFSHGWNNDWTVATRRYEDFIRGFMDLRDRMGLPMPPRYRPLLVGLFWPSTALVWGEDEEGPAIAAGDPARQMDEAVAAERWMVDTIAEELSGEVVDRFYELVQSKSLSAAEAGELAEIVAPLVRSGEAEQQIAPPDPAAILASWRAVAAAEEPAGGENDEDYGVVGAAPSGPQAAGWLDFLDPRPLVRSFTVWTMKDRAGTVGARGVGPLLRELLEKSAAHVHLIGHSFGAKVVLSALCAGGDLRRKVESALLLQPAVSHLCFTDQVPGGDGPGGYHQAPERLVQPILSTFSARDVPLTKAFHVALRRGRDLGEAQIAAPGEPPSRYAALGGFGPRRSGEQLVDILDPGDSYELHQLPPIVGVRGDRTIGGHGKVSNESTWWALHNQVTATA